MITRDDVSPGQEPQAEPQDQSALARAPRATEATGGGSFGQGPHHAQSGATLDGGRFHGGHLTKGTKGSAGGWENQAKTAKTGDIGILDADPRISVSLEISWRWKIISLNNQITFKN